MMAVVECARNRVILYNMEMDEHLAELEFRSKIVGLDYIRDKLIVYLCNKIFTYSNGTNPSLLGSIAIKVQALVSFNDTSISGPKPVEQLPVNSNDTDKAHLMETVLSTFENESGQSVDFPWILNIIISDGICKDHASLSTEINEALEKRIMSIFVILDSRSERTLSLSYQRSNTPLSKMLKACPLERKPSRRKSPWRHSHSRITLWPRMSMSSQ
jgi:hypothetical protein